MTEGLHDLDAQVCSIYGPDTVTQVYSKIKKVESGTAIFTFPNTPVKCPGAPQKIAYIAEDYFRKVYLWNYYRLLIYKKNSHLFYLKHNLRYYNNIDVVYNTALPVIFGVKKYADSLWNVCKNRDITVNLQTNLVKINPNKRQATFEKLNSPGETLVQDVCSLSEINVQFVWIYIMINLNNFHYCTPVLFSPCNASNGTSCSFEGTSDID